MDRRNFLMKAAAGSGLVLLPSILTSCDIVDTSDDKDVTNDIKILTSAAEMEGTAVATYNAAAGLLSAGTLAVAVSFRDHHIQHAETLNNVIAKLGGAKVTYTTRPTDPNTSRVNTEAKALELATYLELQAARAYFTQVAGSLVTPEAKQVMADILPAELAHFSLLRSAQSLTAGFGFLSSTPTLTLSF